MQRRALSVVVGLLALTPSLAAPEQGTAKILAPWEANGQIYQVAVDKLQFIGTFEGIMYIEHGDGLFDTALFTCPSTQIIHVLTNKLEGHGYCSLESPTGDYVYAEFDCNGAPGACRGKLTLTGGTGKLTGIKGESSMIVRTALSGTAIDQESGGTVSAAKGLAIWPDMHFEVPGKNAAVGILGTGPTEPQPKAAPDKPDAEPEGEMQIEIPTEIQEPQDGGQDKSQP